MGPPVLVEVDLGENAAADPPRRRRAPLAAALALLAMAGVVLLGVGRTQSTPPTPSPAESSDAVSADGSGSGSGTETTASTRLTGTSLAPTLAEPWQVQWRRPGQVLAVSESLLVTTAGGTGAVAIDADGNELWGPRADGSTCSPGGRGAVCGPRSGASQVRAVSAKGETVVLDPGFTIAEWWVQDEDALLVGADGGTLVIERWTPPGSRGVAWTYRSPDLLLGAALDIERSDTSVTVRGTRTVVVDLLTGREIASTADASQGSAVPPDPVLGLYDRSAPGVAVVSDGETVVVASRWRLAAPAQLLVAGVVLAGAYEMAAHRVQDGRLLWEATASGAFSDGTLVGLVEHGTRTDLVARDLEYGDLLWSVPLPECAEYRGTTSAGVVLDACGEVLLVGPADAASDVAAAP